MGTACVAGSTGLVGSHLLTTLLKHPSLASIHAFTRKPLPTNPKLHPIEDPTSTSWPAKFPPDTIVFFSALGATARQAGGFANQRKIDYDLNLDLAKAAKKQGVRVYVLISTAAADSTSRWPYPRTRGELDDAVQAVGFERCIILKPGLSVGKRGDSRPGEYAGRRVASFLGAVSGNRWKDPWAQDADVVARAAVAVALDALDGRSREGVRIVEQTEIVRLGRTDWVEKS